MNSLAQTDFNQKLAAACQLKCAACCCKGMLFLPENEFQAIRQWAVTKSPVDLAEFERRTRAWDGFRLYDQQDRCQFLDRNNLCRLHMQGVKPTECFWWPFHVFTAADNALEIRLSPTCCDGYKTYAPGLPLLDIIKSQARSIGHETIRKFREHFPGSHGLITVATLDD